MKKRLLTNILTVLLIITLVFSLGACRKTSEDPSFDNKEEAPGVSDAETRPDSAVSHTTDNPEYTEEQKAFADFLEKEFLETLQDYYTLSHMYYIDPAARGIDVANQNVTFGTVDNDETYQEEYENAQRLIDELAKFDRSKLTRIQQDEYDSLKWEVEMSLLLNDEKFRYYEQLFAAPNSIDINLASYLNIFQIRNEKDAEDAAKLLDSIPEFIDQCLVYSKTQQEKKLLMASFDEVIENCQEILDIGMNSFTLKSMQSKVDELEGVSEDRKTELKKNIELSFEKSYLPSISMVIEGMNDLKKGFNNEAGYAALPNGKEYFNAILNVNLGTTDMTGEKLKEIAQEKYDNYLESLQRLFIKDPTLSQAYYNGSIVSGYDDYNTILEDMKELMLKDYPEVKNLQYNLDLADPEEKLDEQRTAAYFVIPPLDGDHRQEIRVNPSNEDIGSIDTYMTVTHEGFPGHMYQFAYIYENCPSDYLKTMRTDGIGEGFAVYSQYNSLNYLDELEGSHMMITALDSKLAYILYSILDVGVNYDGWTREDMRGYFKENGYTLDDEGVKGIYDFLRSSPGVYETYGYGYEMVNDLRVNAENKLGTKFNSKDFNKAILDAGNTTYEILSRHVDEYVAKNL